MNRLLLRLWDKGNIVFVVEYKFEVIAIVDYVVDLGLGAGIDGGEVVYEGSVEGLWGSDIFIGCYFDDWVGLKDVVCALFGIFEVCGVYSYNFEDVDVDILFGVFVVFIGVVGLGKSLFIVELVLGCDGVVIVD